jgi:ADP-ribose pyrophosphatase
VVLIFVLYRKCSAMPTSVRLKFILTSIGNLSERNIVSIIPEHESDQKSKITIQTFSHPACWYKIPIQKLFNYPITDNRIVMKPWKTLSRNTILDHSRFLKVEDHSVQLPDGKILDHWPWIISPDFVLVMPISPRGTFYLFHQVKYAVSGTSLAPVGGYLEPGEDPLSAAKREVREEMGCVADEWVHLGSFPINGNHGGGNGHLYVAFGAQKVGELIIDDLEEMHMVELSSDELEQCILDGGIKVLGWLAMVATGYLYVKTRRQGK